jgi:hypothetical protein
MPTPEEQLEDLLLLNTAHSHEELRKQALWAEATYQQLAGSLPLRPLAQLGRL